MLKVTNRRNKLYSRILLHFTISTAFAIFAVSLALYMNFERIGLSMVHSFIKDTLSQISYSATFMTDSARTLSTQIYFDYTISSLLNTYQADPLEVDNSLIRLGSFNSSTPYINSIYIYNRNLRCFYTDSSHIREYDWDSFPDTWVKDVLENPGTYKSLVPIPRKILPPYSKKNDTNYSFVYTYILSSSPANVSYSENAIFLNITEEWMRKITDSLDVNPESNTFIIDSLGNVVSSNKKYDMLSNISKEKYISDILNTKKTSGYFVDEIDGVKSLVTYVSSDTIGWKFVRLTPYVMIMNQVTSMKNTTMLIGIIILLGGFLASYLISGRLYSPIDSILSKLKSLEEEKRNNHYPLKQEFLRTLLKEKTGYSLDKIKAKFNQFGISLEANSHVSLMLLKIDHYADFCNKYSISDRNLFRYAIINIAAELCAEKFPNEAADLEDDHIILLFSPMHLDPHEHYQETEELVKSIQVSIKKLLDIELSAAISTTATSLEEASHLYYEVLETSNSFIFQGHGCIIHSGILDYSAVHEYSYPLNREKQLIDALMTEKSAEVKKHFIDIIDGLKDCSRNTLHLTLMRLSIAVNMAVDSIEKNSGFSLAFDFTDFISKIRMLETVNEIHEHFFKMFDNIVQKLEERKDPKYDELKQRIYDIINRNYADINLSRESIAEQVGLSSVYLGRLFLKLTSSSIADHINEVRLQKAKELLTSTTVPVSEIAIQAGFTSSNYFHALFKKLHGVTPNDYRHKATKNIGAEK